MSKRLRVEMTVDRMPPELRRILARQITNKHVAGQAFVKPPPQRVGVQGFDAFKTRDQV